MKNISMGRLVLITGPMFSGKTSRLIELLEREILAGRNTLLFKPEIDKRYDTTFVTTHKGMRLPAIVLNTDNDAVKKMYELSKNVDVIGIDEAQFWDHDSILPEVADRIASEDKIVYVAALNKNHTGSPFKTSMEIIARADQVYSLTAVCAKCGEDATFTQRVMNGKEVFGEQIKIGGTESYEPRCRKCFVYPEENEINKA
ncbi:MAG: thymidine kinase [Ferroplasma sp.]|uniref:thymidine kinase n=1 Tax=Ferroplasma sp. TaxID=2591003 RepID=UPI002814D4CC|nr:thymidine kinase [Ferroplasma sp.]WMT51649.1 MAG: thymidine kinase [Ferroplasma sp.]